MNISTFLDNMLRSDTYDCIFEDQAGVNFTDSISLKDYDNLEVISVKHITTAIIKVKRIT